MSLQIINYDKLVSDMPSKVSLRVKDKYVMVQIPNFDYHITIFRDQWDDYKDVTNRNYHLFHITSNNPNIKCSTYFFVDLYSNRIKKIPDKYFKYEQDSYGFYSSTRSPCSYKLIKPAIKLFQKILNIIQET